MAAQGENPTYMTASNVPKSSGSSKPTLLAFHGSGSNALCHGVQLARLMRILRPHFEVENLEGNLPNHSFLDLLKYPSTYCDQHLLLLPPAQVSFHFSKAAAHLNAGSPLQRKSLSKPCAKVSRPTPWPLR